MNVPRLLPAPPVDGLARHQDYLRARLRGLGVSGANLDDAVQDVFEVLIRRIGDYDSRFSLRQWMAGVARPNAGWYEAVALAYPNLGEIGGDGSPGELSEPTCASPTDCNNQRTPHPTACDGAEPETTGEPGTTGTSGSSDTFDTGNAGTTGAPTTGAATTGVSSAADTGTAESTAESGATPTSQPDATGSTGSTGSTGGVTGGARGDGDDGCGCRGAPVPGDMSLLLLTPLLLRRRDRHRGACHARG